jgi:hypothetical protein
MFADYRRFGERFILYCTQSYPTVTRITCTFFVLQLLHVYVYRKPDQKLWIDWLIPQISQYLLGPTQAMSRPNKSAHELYGYVNTFALFRFSKNHAWHPLYCMAGCGYRHQSLTTDPNTPSRTVPQESKFVQLNDYLRTSIAALLC